MDVHLRTEKTPGAAMEVHRALGPVPLESACVECLAKESKLIGFTFERQKPLPLEYKGLELDAGYRLDFFVEDEVVVERQPVEVLAPMFTAQAGPYLRLLGRPVAQAINFGVPVPCGGITRVVNTCKENSASTRLCGEQ